MLDGKVAIVTGSTSGIGRGIAVRLASLGARVVVHGRDEAAARQTLAAIGEAGGEGDWHRADLADATACSGLVTFAAGRFGALDILVNNAALTTRGDIEHADSGWLLRSARWPARSRRGPGGLAASALSHRDPDRARR